jgi:hypothetical protein
MENNETTINPLTGETFDPNAATRHTRAPLSPLETSRTDAVADYFRERGQEPGYEAISQLAPPLKYVDARFRVYPLVLGEKDFTPKVRLLSNARALHLDVSREREGPGIGGGSWFGADFIASFFAGGEEIQNAQPRWRNGYLPVAEFTWKQSGVEYSLQVLGALLPDTTRALGAWLKIRARRLEPGALVQFDARFASKAPLAAHENYLVHDGGESTQALRAGYSDGWHFDAETQTLSWRLHEKENEGEACLVALNDPREHGLLLEPPGDTPVWAFDIERSRRESGLWLAQWAQPHWWREKRDAYCRAWDAELNSGARVQTPEAVINHAQKAVRAQSRIIATGNQMSYSAQNQYERSYTDESAQAIIGLAYWGHLQDAARYLGPLAFYNQNGLTPHDLGLRLHWYCRYLALSDDNEFWQRNHERMRRWALELLDSLRDEHHGLAPPTKHSGDLKHFVYSFPANAAAWRGARDFALLDGDAELLERTEKYRAAIIEAAQARLDESAAPPFLPVSLYGDEPTPEFLTQTTISSYWLLIMPYGLYAGVLPDDHAVTRALLDTFEQRGGLCAGLVRMAQHEDYTQLTILVETGLDDLYGAKLCDVWARRDEADKLVLALYGKLGLGLTPDTFIAGEGASLAPSRVFGEESSDGRSFYLPPNSASQMMFAILLRHCLVFDFDSRGDGLYDTLRLAFSTPRRWLEDGEKISVEKMPTAFGEVSYEIVSHLNSQNTIEARVFLPQRNPARSTLLRLRAPHGRRMIAITINGQPHAAFDADDETIDLSGRRGEVAVRAEYS